MCENLHNFLCLYFLQQIHSSVIPKQEKKKSMPGRLGLISSLTTVNQYVSMKEEKGIR